MEQSDYKKIYIQESDELLQEMNTNLLILEKEPQNIEALNAIFRSAHTLKGMSASMGYKVIAELAHKMEDALAQLRSGVIKVEDRIVDLLFKSFDSLEAMVLAVQQDKEVQADITNILSSFDAVLVKTIRPHEEKITEDISLNDFEKKTLANVKKDGYSVFIIKINFDKNCVLKSVRAFMVFRNLHSIGEVIKSIPDSQALEEERFDLGFKCIFVTKESSDVTKNNVFEILDVESVVIEEIPINDSWYKLMPTEHLYASFTGEDASLPQSDQTRKIRSVRLNIERLDNLMNLVEELAINKLRLATISERMHNPDLNNISEVLDRLTDDLQTEIMQARLVPVGQIFERFPRLVRDLAKQEGKKIRLDIAGSDIEVDRTVLDEISDPLIHLLRNSIDHGIEMPDQRKAAGKPEEGRVVLVATRQKNYIYIDVEDDGRGMDIELIKALAMDKGLVTKKAIDSMTEQEVLLLTANPGFSTKNEVTDVSGRGVGLDVAKNKVESLGGSILIESNPHRGCKVTMQLPITTAVVKALLVKIYNVIFAIPISNITEIIAIREDSIKKIEHQETVLYRGKVLVITRLDKLFQSLVSSNAPQQEKAQDIIYGRLNIVIVEFGARQFGIVVEGLLSQQDIVIKQLSQELRLVRGFAGATILGDGSVCLVLDVATLV